MKETLLEIPGVTAHHRSIVWESTGDVRQLLACVSDKAVDVYVYHDHRLTGSTVTHLCRAPIGAGQIPVLLQGPELVLLAPSAKLVPLVIAELTSGSVGQEKLSTMTRDEQRRAMQLSLTVGK